MILLGYIGAWLLFTLVAWNDKTFMGTLIARLDVGSAVALAFLAAYAYFETRKGDDFINILIKDTQGNLLDTIETAVQRDHCSRSEIAGVLRSYHGDRGYYQIAFLNTAEYREQLRQIARNKLDHLSIRLTESDRLATLIEESSSQSHKQVDADGTKVFLNISNHPLAEWSESQIQAALDLCPQGQIIDLPFPQVNPSFSTDEVVALAHSYWLESTAVLDQKKQMPHCALIAGEPIMCVALVELLNKQGIKCYSATTHREVRCDDHGQKVSKFNFVRFRSW